jgi:hypothetical protein
MDTPGRGFVAGLEQAYAGLHATLNIHPGILGGDPQFAQAQQTAWGKLQRGGCGGAAPVRGGWWHPHADRRTRPRFLPWSGRAALVDGLVPQRPPAAVRVNGRQVPSASWSWDGTSRTLTVPAPAQSIHRSLVVGYR